MTDRPGQPSLWSATMLTAPAVALVFAGTTAWSVAHPPVATLTVATDAQVLAAQSQQGTEVIRQELTADATRLAELQASLGLLRAQAASLSKAGKAAQAAAVKAAAQASTSGRSGARTSGGSAPVSHTSTGASGAKR